MSDRRSYPGCWDLWKALRSAVDLDLLDRFLIFDIHSYGNGDGSSAFPSIAQLALDTGRDRRTIRRRLKRLEVAGWIGRRARWKPSGAQNSNLFELGPGMTAALLGVARPASAPQGGVTPVSPSPCHPCHPPPVTRDRPPLTLVSEGGCHPCHPTVLMDRTQGPEDPPSPPEPSPAGDVVNLYHEICGQVFPRVHHLTPNRRKLINARVRELGIDGLRGLFTKAVESPFLCGKNDSGWTASFDWLLKQSNAAKVIEGTYAPKANRQTTAQTPASFHPGDVRFESDPAWGAFMDYVLSLPPGEATDFSTWRRRRGGNQCSATS